MSSNTSKTTALLLLLATAATAVASSSSILPVTYQCPKNDEVTTTNNNNENVDSSSSNKTKSWNTWADFGKLHTEILTNLDVYLETFRDAKFDMYDYTYNEYKEGLRPFKTKYFSKYLQKKNKEKPTTLYESASGIGLNLLMTLEIMEEDHGINGITVYGNEYVDASTIKSRHVLDALVPSSGKGNQNGVLCTADSTNHSFVPPESMDVVYTGYISPNINPLGLSEATQDLNYAEYRKLCEAKPTEQDKIQLRDQAQQIQNDWFGTWVSEMTRITKPGGAVILEQVAVPYCDCYIDWGGVPKSFWKEAIENNTYGWNIEPSSLVIEDDPMHVKRYRVVMEKKMAEIDDNAVAEEES